MKASESKNQKNSKKTKKKQRNQKNQRTQKTNPLEETLGHNMSPKTLVFLVSLVFLVFFEFFCLKTKKPKEMQKKTTKPRGNLWAQHFSRDLSFFGLFVFFGFLQVFCSFSIL